MAKAKKKVEERAEEILEGQNIAVSVSEELPATEVPITQDDIRLVEAVLFASSTPVSIEQIAERFPEERVSVIPDVLDMLHQHYQGRGIHLVQRDKKWAFRTASDLADALRIEKDQPKKFTRAAMETMAIIAYHQPVTRAEVENIRGVAISPGSLDALMEAGWIKPGKRREVPGRPVTWLTTQAFLDHFGIERLDDLPGMDELKAAGLLDKRPAIEAMPTTSDLFGDEEGGLDDVQDVTDEDLIGKADSDDDEDFQETLEEDEMSDSDDDDFDSDDADEDDIDADNDDDDDDFEDDEEEEE